MSGISELRRRPAYELGHRASKAFRGGHEVAFARPPSLKEFHEIGHRQLGELLNGLGTCRPDETNAVATEVRMLRLTNFSDHCLIALAPHRRQVITNDSKLIALPRRPVLCDVFRAWFLALPLHAAPPKHVDIRTSLYPAENYLLVGGVKMLEVVSEQNGILVPGPTLVEKIRIGEPRRDELTRPVAKAGEE